MARKKKVSKGTQFDLASFLGGTSSKSTSVKKSEVAKTSKVKLDKSDITKISSKTNKAIDNFIGVWDGLDYRAMSAGERVLYLTDAAKLSECYIDANVYDDDYYKFSEVPDEHKVPKYLRDIYIAKRLIEKNKFIRGIDPRATIGDVAEKLSFDNKFSFRMPDSFVEFIKMVKELRELMEWS